MLFPKKSGERESINSLNAFFILPSSLKFFVRQKRIQMLEKMIICWWNVENREGERELQCLTRQFFFTVCFAMCSLTLSCNSNTPCLLTNAGCCVQFLVHDGNFLTVFIRIYSLTSFGRRIVNNTFARPPYRHHDFLVVKIRFWNVFWYLIHI